MNPSDLIPYVNNTKKHPKEQIDKLISSMKEFKFDVPIVVDKDMVIIKGHARREAAVKGGFESVPVIVREDLTPAQVKAARIADNKLAESEWDYETLKIELESLKEISFDLNFTGFDGSVINALLNSHVDHSFGVYGGNEDEFDDNYDVEYNETDNGGMPSDYQNVQGSKDGKSWLVMFSFDTKEKAEDFLTRLNVENPIFVKNSESKTVDGEVINFDKVFRR